MGAISYLSIHVRGVRVVAGRNGSGLRGAGRGGGGAGGWWAITSLSIRARAVRVVAGQKVCRRGGVACMEEGCNGLSGQTVGQLACYLVG